MKTNPIFISHILVITVFMAQATCLYADTQVSGDAPTEETSLKGGEVPTSTSSKLTSPPKFGPFVIMPITKWEAELRSSGSYYYSIFYAENKKVLEELAGNVGPGKRRVAIFLCKGGATAQARTIKKFAPIVDEIGIWAFFFPGRRVPQPSDVIWPGYNNPFINRLRELRKVAGNTRLLAVFHLAGNGSLFWGVGERVLSFEEIKWLVFATIGSDWDGVLWDGHAGESARATKCKRLEIALQRHADQIGEADPVDWVQVSGGKSVTALCSNKKLFVVMLNPNYMKPDFSKKQVPGPVNFEVQKLDMTINLPGGVGIRSGVSLSGKRVKLDSGDGQIHVKYRFKGGGDILIFDLIKDHADADKQSSEKTERNNR